MRSHVTRWGNSLALRLPKNLAADAKLREGAAVEMRVEGESLVVRAARPRYRLKDLLRNELPERTEEVDWGRPEGDEAW